MRREESHVRVGSGEGRGGSASSGSLGRTLASRRRRWRLRLRRRRRRLRLRDVLRLRRHGSATSLRRPIGTASHALCRHGGSDTNGVAPVLANGDCATLLFDDLTQVFFAAQSCCASAIPACTSSTVRLNVGSGVGGSGRGFHVAGYRAPRPPQAYAAPMDARRITLPSHRRPHLRRHDVRSGAGQHRRLRRRRRRSLRRRRGPRPWKSRGPAAVVASRRESW